jgi:hypothetical protein
MTKQLVGFYHPHGYNLWTMESGRLLEQVYEAGNNPAESTSMVTIEQGEDLETLERYCEQTGKEMAGELGIPWGGCVEEVDPYESIIL